MVAYNPKKLNVGVVGIGRMGQRHALNILYRTPRASLLCVCSPAKADLDWADENLKPHGVQIFATFEEMIQVPNLEAVVIASATAMHAEQCIVSLKLGIHVLCEKPVTIDMKELLNVVEVCKSYPHAQMMVGFTRRFDDSYRYAVEKINDGTIGRPVVVRSHGYEAVDASGFFINYARASGGIFVDTTIHDIDLALSFFGDEIQPKALWATGTVAKYDALREFQDCDNAVGVVEFWGGKIAHFFNSRAAVFGYDNSTEIFGTSGKLTVNAVARKNRVEISASTGVLNEIHPSWIDRYQDAFVTEANGFTNAILDGNPLPLKIESAVTSLKIGLALQESLITGQRIEFDEQGNRKLS